MAGVVKLFVNSQSYWHTCLLTSSQMKIRFLGNGSSIKDIYSGRLANLLVAKSYFGIFRNYRLVYSKEIKGSML